MGLKAMCTLVMVLGVAPCATLPSAAGPYATELKVCGGMGNQDQPTIVSDGKGGAIIAWFDSRSGSWEIYAQHVLASGAVDSVWTAANGNASGTLLRHAVEAYQPYGTTVSVSDGAGGAIVAWTDYRNGSGNGDVYAQHVLASGIVDPAWSAANGNANGTALCRAVNDQILPTIVSDGAGGAIATWFDSRSGNEDVYAQHVLASGVVDPAWSAANGNANGTRLCHAAGEQSASTLVSDGAGGAIVTWSDGRRGTDERDIYAQHVLATGVVDPAWSATNGNEDGTTLCGAEELQLSPAIVSDGAGGAIVTWYDYRSSAGTTDIYAQHVLATGEVDPAWSAANGNADGTLLCNAGLDQTFPVLVPDGAGGAIVAWGDGRSGTGTTSVYAQHVLASGVIDSGWTAANGNPNGTVLCSTAGIEDWRIISDGAGGAIVAWQDYRTGAYETDIYAQHVLASGVVDPVWIAARGDVNGIPVCAAPDEQSEPAAVSDGSGGAIVAWQDLRDPVSAWDVYAQHVVTPICDGVAPIAFFTGSPINGASPLLVQFTDDTIVGSDPITSWLWNFGDGDTSTAQNPSHTYDTECHRKYTVTLTVAAGWCRSTLARENYIEVLGVPRAPSLASPANGASELTAVVPLSWTAATCAAYYCVQVSTDTSFFTRVVDTTSVHGTGYVATLAAGTWYHWRVSASGGFRYGPYSPTWSFSTAAAAGGPTLIAPANGTVGAPTNQVYRWNAVSGATSYRLQVSTSPSFSGGANVPGIHDTTYAIGLGEFTTYFWRVQATTAAGPGPFSATWTFTTGARRPPGPTLVEPVNGSLVYTSNPTLSWEPVDGALSYRLRVSTNSSFSTTVVDQPSLPGTSCAVNLAGAASYYWRVNANYSDGPGLDSDTWRFTTFTAVPAKPALVAPPNGATGVPTDATLRWTPVTGAVSYRLQVSTTADFSTLVVDRAGIHGDSSIEGLAGTTRYFWRVSASNPLGTSPYTASWSFTTAERQVHGPGGDPGRMPAGDASILELQPGAPGFAAQGAGPNRMSGNIVVSLSLPSAAPATLDLFDVAGRRVMSRSVEFLGPGRHVLTLEEGKRLPNGLYVLRLTQDAASASIRITIIR